MSRLVLLKSFLVISIGAVAGYNTVDFLKNKNSPHRYMASMTMSKMASEQISKSLLDIRIKNVDLAVNEDHASTVTVTLLAYKPLPAGLAYSWNIHDDMQVVDGQTNGILPAFSANQSIELTLKIKGYNKIKRSYVSFSIKGDVESTKFLREVLASSRPEDSFEYVVQEYERSKSNEGRINKLGKAESKGPIDPKKVIH